MNTETMQLEFWLPKGRKGGSWIPQHRTFGLTGFSKAWRKVKQGHTHKDKLSHSIAMRSRVSDRTKEDICASYLQWARLKGLDTVSVFPSSYGQLAALPFGFATREVDPSDYDGIAPSPVLDDAS